MLRLLLRCGEACRRWAPAVIVEPRGRPVIGVGKVIAIGVSCSVATGVSTMSLRPSMGEVVIILES